MKRISRGFICFVLCVVMALLMYSVALAGTPPGFITATPGAEDEYASFDALSAVSVPDGFSTWWDYLQSRGSNITIPNRRLIEEERNEWIVDYHATGGPSAFEVEVMRLINDIRLDRGLNPLAVDMTFMYASRFYAQTKANLNLGGGHFRGPYGGSWRTLTAFGETIDWRGGNGATAWGGPFRTPESLVNGWMRSTGHRNHLLRPHFTRFSAGTYLQLPRGRWEIYHYMLFCSGDVITPLQYDDIAVHLDYHAFRWNSIRGVNAYENNIVANLSLPTSGLNGSDISWVSSNPDIISESGIVTRPEIGRDSVNVVLTATIRRGTESATREFNLTVVAQTNCVIVRATNHPYAFINLTTETIHVPFRVGVLSVDGGRRWRNRTLPTGRALTNLFNRELTLSVRSWDERWGETRIDFPRINARPRANAERLRPWYSADTWTLRARPTGLDTPENPPAAPVAVYEWVQGNISNGRIPASPEWELLPHGFAFDVTPTPARGVRNVHFFRTAPVANNGIYTPASRPFRIRPVAFRRQLNLAVNYTSETIRTRIGQEYSIDGGVTWNPVPTEIADNRLRAALFDVSIHITSGSALYIRTEATGRRTSSIPQPITFQPRAPLATTLPLELVVNGRIDANALRPYSVRITAANGTQSWRALPRITASNAGQFDIRVNSTVRRDRNAPTGWSGFAASQTGTLTVIWGVIGQDSRGNNVMGVTSAIITP